MSIEPTSMRPGVTARIAATDDYTPQAPVPDSAVAYLRDNVFHDTATGLPFTPSQVAAIDLRAQRAATVDIRDFLASGVTQLPKTNAVAMTTLLQLAFDTLAPTVATSGPVQIFVPEGVYLTGGDGIGVIARSGVGIRGASRDGTVFRHSGNKAFIRSVIADPYNGTDSFDDCRFTDFTVDCTAQTGPTDTGSSALKGFFIQHMNRARFERVAVLNTWMTGFGLDYLTDAVFENCIAKGCGRNVAAADPTLRLSAGAGFGIGMGMAALETVQFINCQSIGNGTSGFFFEHLARDEAIYSARGVSLVGCVARDNWVGLTDAGGREVQTTGCQFFNNQLAGVRVRSTATKHQGGRDGKVTDCLIYGNGSATGGCGVEFYNARKGGYTVSNSQIVGNLGPGIRFSDGSDTGVGAGVTLNGNLVAQNAGAGILLADVTTNPLRPVILLEIRGNRIRQNRGDGISMLTPTIRVNIADNTISANLGQPIAFRGARTSVEPRIQRNDLAGSVGSILIEHTITDQTGITANIATAGASLMNATKQPSAEGLITSWSASTGTATKVTGGHDNPAGNCVRFTPTTASGRIQTNAATVVAGELWTGSIWVKGQIGKIYFAWFALPSGSSTGPQVVGTGDWMRLTMTGLMPSSGGLRMAVSVSSGTWIAGDTYDVDEAMLTKGPDIWDYFDGNSGTGFAWTGTALESESTFTPA